MIHGADFLIWTHTSQFKEPRDAATSWMDIMKRNIRFHSHPQDIAWQYQSPGMDYAPGLIEKQPGCISETSKISS